MPIVTGRKALIERVLAAGDQQFAEEVRILFMKDSKDDPLRTNLDVIAPLRVGTGEARNMSGERSRDLKVSVIAATATLSIDPATYDGPNINVGDIVVATERPGKPRFEVRSIDDRSHTRLVLHLNMK